MADGHDTSVYAKTQPNEFNQPSRRPNKDNIMNRRQFIKRSASAVAAAGLVGPAAARAEGEWEITPESEVALARGLKWLAENQGVKGNWGSSYLSLAGMGALAFLADGHLPGRGKYGRAAQRALSYVIDRAKPNGLLSLNSYEQGLATFVLGQAYGMTNDDRLGGVLDGALKVIQEAQCDDGGWDYAMVKKPQGHDLSLAVMQAKALRSAMDCGLEIRPEVIEKAIAYVRRHFRGNGFGYTPSSEPNEAMTAAGVVCLQEFGQYDEWRIEKALVFLRDKINGLSAPARDGKVPFNAYALYYVAQALYQAGGDHWKTSYPKLRDHLVGSQVRAPGHPEEDGKWVTGAWLTGKDSDLYGTSAACFTLAIPNRYLPILQEGKIESLRQARHRAK